MESNPEEFFGDAPKWNFMFKPNFREVLTEPEKGALHEALKAVRRKEFDSMVFKELLTEEMEQTVKIKASGRYATQLGITNSHTTDSATLNRLADAANISSENNKVSTQLSGFFK
jgi:hypothetical protein